MTDTILGQVTPTQCACGGGTDEAVLSLPPTPLCDAFKPDPETARGLARYPLDLVRCNSCGLVRLKDVAPPEFLYSDYIYTTASSLGLAEHFDVYADDLINRYGLGPSDLVVDIGCNDGTLLQAFDKRSVRVLGVEPSPVGAAAQDRLGLPIMTDFFSKTLAENIKKNNGPARLITANNVIANILDLPDFLEGVWALMDDKSVFVFETFYLPDLLKNLVVEMINHEHYYYFTVGALQTILKRYGLDLVDASRVETKGGSLRVTAAVNGTGGNREPSGDGAALLQAEQEMDLGLFKSRMDATMTAVGGMVDDLAGQGATVAGFGAAAGTTILLSCTGTESHIKVLADDNPDRHGMYAPGTGIPVVSPEDLYELRPDVTVLYAWRYAEPIIAKHRDALGPDHKFILPLPEPRIVNP